MQVFLPNSFRIKHFERKKRVRDWKGYGIVQQCGTCKPLQSRTSSSRITSDIKDKIAGWHPAKREEAAELMLCVRDVILPLAELAETGHRWHRTPRTDVGRADVLAFGKEIATVDTALLNRQSNSCLRSPQGLQILGDPIILNRRNGRRRNGVCQTSATAKKKKPDGFQNWLHVHNACWRYCFAEARLSTCVIQWAAP